jgi:hypothetical protein
MLTHITMELPQVMAGLPIVGLSPLLQPLLTSFARNHSRTLNANPSSATRWEDTVL